MFIKGQILLLILNIGFVHTSAPKIVFKSAPRDFRTVPEDFNGTLFQLHITDPDQGDNIIVVPNNDLTRKYLSIIQTPSNGNDVTVNVTVKQPLDRESSELGDSFEVKLQIKDDTGNVVGYKFSVFIDDINDNIPVFDHIPYKLDIPELPCHKTVVYDNIHATDKDKNANGRVTYSMEPKAQSEEARKMYSDTFSIDPKTGKVTLTQCLDYENNSYYQFNITAKDQGPNGGSESFEEFIIRVNDVQDRPPVFEGVPYFKSIREDAKKGYSILQVKARDGDPGVSNNVKYSITDNNCGHGLFAINSSTGDVIVNNTIDRDDGLVKNNSGNCFVTVQASEINKTTEVQYGKTTTLANVTINVEDVDDNIPIFSLTNYSAYVNENTPEDTPVNMNSTIWVSDNDQGENALIKLSVIDKNGSNTNDFAASPNEIQGSGNVKILVKNYAKLDYEQIHSIEVVLKATEKTNTSKTATTSINIKIVDRNDNSPQFNNTKFTFDVKESTKNGIIIGIITATDADTLPDYKTIDYTLSGGSERFTVDKDSGTIRTSCKNCSDELDREKRDEYYMTLFATDHGGNRNSTEVVVTLTDINDNNPTFSRPYYTKFIEENSNDLDIVKLEATDRDDQRTNNSKFTFSIHSTHGMPQANFTINDTTGDIKLKTPIDYERLTDETGIVSITVMVNDLGSPSLNSTSTVTLTVQDKNDNSPTFNSNFTGNVKESATSNTTDKTQVTHVFANDSDSTAQNHNLSYFKTSGSEKFVIDSSSGAVNVSINAKLDRETEPSYTLTIIAIDTGSPTLTGTAIVSIQVTDVNDEPPTFQQIPYTASVKEDLKKPTIIYNCSASDKDEDSNLTYSVTVMDARDENGQPVNKTYVKDYFSIHSNNGSVYVAGTLDRETAKTITLSIKVEDQNAVLNRPQNDTTTLTVTLLDVNDNNPKFGSKLYNISVAEDAGDMRQYNGPTATDKDENRTITYSLLDGPGPISSFKIENTTGMIIKNGELDRETNSSVTLTVFAVDNGVPPRKSSVEVIVTVTDANDNAPIFTNDSRNATWAHIKENVSDRTLLVDINATDADSGPNNNNITYFLKNEYFGINEMTGVIRVIKSPDREENPHTLLTIIAKDNPINSKAQKTSSMSITVTIYDENDENPTFRQNYTVIVEEDKEVGSIILQVSASDDDEPNTNNSNISYSVNTTYENKFSIDVKTGDIKINSTLIDHVDNYTLEVIAKDHGSPERNGTTYVHIRVTDKNRHKPVIENVVSDKLLIKVYECAPSGTPIHVFSYTDADSNKYDNARASFNITTLQDNITNIFNITEDGTLMVVGKLDVNVKPSYQFGVMATDHGIPQLSSKVVKITVIVEDVNDHLPSFPSTKVTFSLKENITGIHSIGSIQAFDKDIDSRICYDLKDHKWDSYFNISKSNNKGEIHILNELDHETNKTVTFEVETSDCSIAKNLSEYCNKTEYKQIQQENDSINKTLEVTIVVIDVDDNPPVFINKQMATGMRRNTEADTELDYQLRNKITDADTPPNGILSWEFSNYGNITISSELQGKIKSNSGARPCSDGKKHIFCVTANGTIINNKFYSEDLSGFFILSVKVNDSGGFDIGNITIYLISDTQVITMTLNDNKEVVGHTKDTLLATLSKILGFNAVFDNLQDHKEKGELIPYKSDLRFHIVDPQTNAVLPGKDAVSLFDKHASNAEMLQLQNEYHVLNVAQKSISDEDEDTSSNRLTFILLAISVAEAVVISLIIFIAISARNKFRRKLKAAAINTPDMEMQAHAQKEIAIPGSNLYSKTNNPLLNADIANVKESTFDNNSLDSSEDLNLDENEVGDPHTVYDKIEEREVTLDMYTDDTGYQNVSSEDLLNAAINQHALRKSKESLDQLDGDDSIDTRSESPKPVAYLNNSFIDDLESTEI